ncbi:hypothetical protein FRC06_007991, partial [Ceratobasidium sp. 370]
MVIKKPAKANKDRKRKLGSAAQLKGAVRALGGDEQDLELLAGVESDEEPSGGKKNGAKSQGKLPSRELAQFVKSLNLPAASDADQIISAKSKGKGKEKAKDDKVKRKPEQAGESKPEGGKESKPEGNTEKARRKQDEAGGKPGGDDKGKKNDKREKEGSKRKAQDKQPRTIKPLPSSNPSTVEAPTPNKSGKKAKLVVTPSSKWYDQLPPITPSNVRLSENKLSALAERAAALHVADTTAFSDSQFGLSSADAHFLESVLQGGTRSDRLSALTLVVQGAPVHSTRSLDGLRAMASKKGGRGE